MFSEIIDELGRPLKVDSNGRVYLGSKYKNVKDLKIYYDILFSPNIILVTTSTNPGEGLVLAVNKSFNCDQNGRITVPPHLRKFFDKGKMFDRDNYFIVIKKRSTLTDSFK